VSGTKTTARSNGHGSLGLSSVAQVLVEGMWARGVGYAFGVSGGGIIETFLAFLDSRIKTRHFANEGGAAFAAKQTSVALRQLVALFATTGPGLANLANALWAARTSSDAKLVVVTGRTPARFAGRFTVQEVSSSSMQSSDFFVAGKLFDEVAILETVEQLPQVFALLANGASRPGPFLMHISVPLDVQGRAAQPVAAPPPLGIFPTVPDPAGIARVAELLASDSFAFWLGRGAQHASAAITELVDITNAPVIETGAGKGAYSELRWLAKGVTGLGGHDSAVLSMQAYRPAFLVVLGTTLGEASTSFDARLLPAKGFVHVDIDPMVPARAFPSVPTLAIHGDVSRFVEKLLDHSGELPRQMDIPGIEPYVSSVPACGAVVGTVRPSRLMAAMQRQVVVGGEAPVLAEAGTSMALVAHHLRFGEAGRNWHPDRHGSMGDAATSVLGAAIASDGPAVCLTGDGALLMQCELSTAAKYGIPAVWVVLNDARLGIVSAGMARRGRTDLGEVAFPRVDFALLARAMGATGVRVDDESELDDALRMALDAGRPVVLDVIVNTAEQPPYGARMRFLDEQHRQGDGHE